MSFEEIPKTNLIAATGLAGRVGQGVQHATANELTWQDLGTSLTESTALDAAIAGAEADTIVNYAAFTDVAAAWEERGDQNGECYRVNTLGAHNIAQSCKQHGKYLIHISTDYVYSGSKPDIYTEEDATGPVEWYGQTKALAEERVLGVDDSFAVFRISSPFKAIRHPNKDDILSKVRRQISGGLLPPSLKILSLRRHGSMTLLEYSQEQAY